MTTPVTPVQTPSAPAAVPAAPAKATADKQFILIAEDDKFYARIYETKLSRLGFDTTVVCDGKDVLPQIQIQRPCLIVLDLMMPVQDGFDTLRQLKADPKLKDIPVIVISNLSQGEDVNEALKMGAVDYFIKANISIEEMVQKIRKYV